MAPTSVVIIIIGDEILKGQVQDTNSHYIARQLHIGGFRLESILTVPDDVAAIADAVTTWSVKSNFVITAGGIGPTHDDVTYEGVAAAFRVDVAHHKVMEKALKKGLGCEPGKMAVLPINATLVIPPGSKWVVPVVRVNNVFILPGVPSFCQAGCEAVLWDMQKECEIVQFFTQSVILRADETQLLEQINAVVGRFKERVSVGSYPYETAKGAWQTRISLESTSVDDLCEARAALVSSVQPGLVDTSLTEQDVNRVYDLAAGNSPFAKTVQSAIRVIEEGLESYAGAVLSFNGGKDCTALLHLLWAVYSRNNKGKIDTLYIESDDTFPEITEFIDGCVTRYGLALHSLPGPLKPALETYNRDNSTVAAVWLGSRRSDPHAQQEHFKACDSGWPPLMRVSPILDWTYDDVWRFLRCLAVPYCPLYDQGYSSLGCRSNTTPNSALLDPLTNSFRPAYTLRDSESERSGRR